jgi:hypothetical protein
MQGKYKDQKAKGNPEREKRVGREVLDRLAQVI